MSELFRVTGYDAGNGEWKGDSIWRTPWRGGVSGGERVLPPLASGRSAGGSVVAVPAGAKPGDGAVAVDPEDPATVAPPGVAGLPSPAVTGEWGGRKVVAVPPSEAQAADAPEAATDTRVVGYPDGKPVLRAADERSG